MAINRILPSQDIKLCPWPSSKKFSCWWEFFCFRISPPRNFYHPEKCQFCPLMNTLTIVIQETQLCSRTWRFFCKLPSYHLLHSSFIFLAFSFISFIAQIIFQPFLSPRHILPRFFCLDVIIHIFTFLVDWRYYPLSWFVIIFHVRNAKYFCQIWWILSLSLKFCVSFESFETVSTSKSKGALEIAARKISHKYL